MYQTKQRATIEKKNAYTTVEMDISQKNNVTRIDCIKQLFESSNRKASLSNTVILLTFEEYMNNC